jgi:hypothetical protein
MTAAAITNPGVYAAAALAAAIIVVCVAAIVWSLWVDE